MRAQCGQERPGFCPVLLFGVGFVQQRGDFAVARFFLVQFFQQFCRLFVSAVLDVDFGFGETGQAAVLVARVLAGEQQVVVAAFFGILAVGGDGGVFKVDDGVLAKAFCQFAAAVKVAFGAAVVAGEQCGHAAFQQAIGFVLATHGAVTAKDLRAVPEPAECFQDVVEGDAGDKRE